MGLDNLPHMTEPHAHALGPGIKSPKCVESMVRLVLVHALSFVAAAEQPTGVQAL